MAINVLQKYFEVVDAEDTAVAYLAALAGGKYLYIPPAAVERVTERNDVTQFQDRAVGFPYGNIDGVAGVEHGASGRYVYRASHCLRIDYVIGRSEYAARGRQAHYRAVVCISPCELDGVKFLVAVLYLTGAVGDED